MSKKGAIPIIFLLLICVLVYQVLSATSGIDGVSPDVANFEAVKSGAQDLFTGDMATAFNVLTVPGRGGLDFPINLGYTAGIRVDEEASWVGLGWNINPGAITRAVNGIPDEKYTGLFYDTTDYTQLTLPKKCVGSGNEKSNTDQNFDRKRTDNWYVSFGAGGGKMLVEHNDVKDANGRYIYGNQFSM